MRRLQKTFEHGFQVDLCDTLTRAREERVAHLGLRHYQASTGGKFDLPHYDIRGNYARPRVVNSIGAQRAGFSGFFRAGSRVPHYPASLQLAAARYGIGRQERNR